MRKFIVFANDYHKKYSEALSVGICFKIRIEKFNNAGTALLRVFVFARQPDLHKNCALKIPLADIQFAARWRKRSGR